MRSCCAEPSEGVGVREAERESPPARCGRWLSDLLHRLCPCLLGESERDGELTLYRSELNMSRVPQTGVRRRQTRRTAWEERAPNTSRSTPEDADQPTTDQRLPRSRPGRVTGNVLRASLSYKGPYKWPEELQIPRMGRARRVAWEPESAPRVHHDSQPSSTLEGQVLHHLVQEEHLGPTVAELEDPWQRQLAPVQELPETPVLERRDVSPASAPAELEDVPAVASASEPAPELEPHEPTAGPSRPRMGRDRRPAWEPEHVPCTINASQPSSTLEGQVLHHLVQEEHLGPTVAELEGEGLWPGDHLGWASRTGVPFKAVRALL
ncbi:uncharacterized protein [Manis javanica]